MTEQPSQQMPKNLLRTCTISFVATVICGFVLIYFFDKLLNAEPLLGMGYFFLGIPLQFVYCVVSLGFFSKGIDGFVLFSGISTACLALLMLYGMIVFAAKTDWMIIGGFGVLGVIYNALVWLMAFSHTEKTDA